MEQQELPLVSIVVPVYKVNREYVIQCLDSIKAQSYSRWEVVIIDDGNPEDYAKWLDVQQETFIRVIHQCNQGVSAARNRGIEESKGEWIYFCDPDDWMHTMELEKLVNAALMENADIVVCGYTEVPGGTAPCEQGTAEAGAVYTLRGKECEQVLFELIAPGSARCKQIDIPFEKIGLMFPWAHLYCRTLIQDVHFPVGIHPGEDILFNLDAGKKANSIAIVNEKLHYYRIGVGVTSVYRPTAMENSLKVWMRMMDFANTRLNGLIKDQYFRKAKMNEISSSVKRYFLHPDNPRRLTEVLRELKEYLQDDWCQKAIADWRNPYYTKKQRALTVILRLKLYFLLFILKKG